MVGREVVEICKKVKNARVAQLARAPDCDSGYFRSSRNVGNQVGVSPQGAVTSLA